MRNFFVRIVSFSLCAMIVMTGCRDGEDNDPVPTETTVTTPPIETDYIDNEEPVITFREEQVPISEKKEEAVTLAEYDPFPNTVYKELSEAVGIISDALVFLHANPTGFYEKSEYYTTFADHETVLEKNDEMEYAFSPVNPEYAATEEELFDRLRAIFTENYISDDDLRNTLFQPEDYDGQPLYKVIDGILCMKQFYGGVMTKIYNDEITLLSINENGVEIVAYGTGVAFPPSHIFMELIRASDGTWQLDSCEWMDYNENEATLLYNAIELPTKILNEILGGGTAPEDPVMIDINGSTYIETELDMDIRQMQEYFKAIFFTDIIEYNDFTDDYQADRPLLEEYLKKYIDDVYYEQDGRLFRNAASPRWYLPKIEIDPYVMPLTAVYIGSGSAEDLFNGNGGFFTCDQPFRDDSGEIFSSKVTVCYKSTEDHEGYEYIRIAGELPIMERYDQ